MSSDLSRDVRSAEKIVDAGQPELDAHSEDDQSHKPCHHVVQKIARATCTRPAADPHNDPHNSHGYCDRDKCGDWQRQLGMRNSERDDSGNSARAGRVRDRFSAAPAFERSLACGELPRNIENPIQVSTPPPAIEKASSEMPKICSTLAPASAATSRMTNTANAALVASVIRMARV
jgi:hypothetical protein